jgi:hypothetical protein
VVDADRKVLIVGGPEILEDELGQRARVAEDERGLVPLDLAHDVLAAQRPEWPDQGMRSSSGSRIAISASAPGSPRTTSTVRVAMGREPALIGFRVGDGGGKGDPAQAGGETLQPGQREREEVAALAAGEGVDLVDHHRLQAREERRAVFVAEQQAERFGGGEQYLRRAHALAGLAVGGGVAGAGLDPDRQAHLADRGQEVALDVHGQCLERRDVQGVEPLPHPFGPSLHRFELSLQPFGLSLSKPPFLCGRRGGEGRPFDRLRASGGGLGPDDFLGLHRFDQLHQRREETGQGLAGAGGRDKQRASAGPRGGEHLELVAARGPALGGEPLRDDWGKSLPFLHAGRGRGWVSLRRGHGRLMRTHP